MFFRRRDSCLKSPNDGNAFQCSDLVKHCKQSDEKINRHKVRFFKRARAQAENKLHQHKQFAGKHPNVMQLMLQDLAETLEFVFSLDITRNYIKIEKKKQT